MTGFRFSTRGLASLALVGLLAGASVTSACSRQSEGERCSLANGNDDCDGDLVCTPASDLRDGADDVDRCCPSDDTLSDTRCAPRVGGSGTGGSTGTGGATNLGGAGGDTSGQGDTCDFNSDCQEGLICGPAGTCRLECLAERDCIAPLVCSADFRCVAAGSAGASN